MYVCLENAGSTLTIRSEPSSSSDAAGSLRHRDRVEVLGISGGWAKIASFGTQRYVKAEYLMQKQPAALSKTSGTTPTGKPAISGIKSAVIKVYKSRRELELWDGKKMAGSWRIALGWEPEGHKQAEGDGRTPEGSYYVCTRNANSSFYKSLGVSYPNKDDASAAFEDGRITKSQQDTILSAIDNKACPPWNTPLGGAIMIHGCGSGSDWTAGCIAVENDIMDILWECCKMGTKILIYP